MLLTMNRYCTRNFTALFCDGELHATYMQYNIYIAALFSTCMPVTLVVSLRS